MKKRGRDFAVTALAVVEQAIGEHMDGTPLESVPGQQHPRHGPANWSGQEYRCETSSGPRLRLRGIPQSDRA